MKKNLHVAIVLLTSFLGVLGVSGQGKYASGDFHQHTTYTDGGYSFGYMMQKNNDFGLDFWVNSEHGGAFDRLARVSGQDVGLDTLNRAISVTWKEVGVPLMGTPNKGNMWRWQSLRDWSFQDVELYRRVFPTKLIIQGLEWNAPGHEHVDVCIIDNQFDATDRNCNLLAEFEYKFDNGDKDVTNPNGWVKSANTGKAKTLEAVQWMQTNCSKTGWIIPTHPERANAFKIEDFRNMNNAGPDVCFGFDSQPGHQKESNRGGYRSSSYGSTGKVNGTDGATWGGTGIFAAKIGGVWDALLSEGRKWWLFANSDCHYNDGDFFPGEYQKTKVYVTDTKNAQNVVDGLRSGNSYVVMGDLIDSLKFIVGNATMGQTYNATTNKVTISIIVRDPQTNNNNTYSALKNPELDHIDLIAGKVGALIEPTNTNYNVDNVSTTKVIARFGKTAHTDAGGIVTQVWNDLGNGVKEITYEATIESDMYFRLRGTHHAFGVPDTEIDVNGNPIVDPFGTNTAAKAFEDLWFYSNPIFVKKSGASGVKQLTTNDVKIYPNPSKETINISFKEPQEGIILINDMTGKNVVTTPLKKEISKQITVKNLQKGIYTLCIKDYAQKIIIE